MARNKSGGFNKLLNFIGLVDDEDTQDTYGEEYSSDNYGRRAAYTPARQQRTTSAAGSRQERGAERRASAHGVMLPATTLRRIVTGSGETRGARRRGGDGGEHTHAAPRPPNPAEPGPRPGRVPAGPAPLAQSAALGPRREGAGPEINK